ncbi:hypothetical protein JCM10212_005804 [Sporobolomyces blumeae]
MVLHGSSSRVADLVQPTERLAANLDDVQDAASRSATDGRARPAWVRSRTGRRGLAVVVREGKQGGEMAAVLVWHDSVVVGVLPILADFGLAIEQTDKLAPNGSTTPRTRFLIALSAPTSPTSPPSRAPFTTSFSFLCDAVEAGTTEFLNTLKRLHQVAVTKGFTATSKSHEWSKSYLPSGPSTPSEGTASGASTPGLVGPTKPFPTGDFDRISAAYSTRAKTAQAAGQSRSDSKTAESGDSSPRSTRGHRNLDSPDERSPDDNSTEMQEAIEHWVVEQMRKRENEFRQTGQIRVWCGTFNVNDRQPRLDGSDLRSWIKDGLGAELLVFSFQELDLSTEAMIRYTPHREEAWREAIDAAMQEKRSDYERLHSKQLVGALIMVYVRKDVRPHVSNVSSASLATGFLGMMANKGAVGVRFCYKDSPIVFVNSHLAAFTSQVQQRNAQYHDILSQLIFPFVEGEGRGPWTPDLSANETTEPPPPDGWSASEAEVLVWMGDLNYRLESSRNEVEQLIKAKKYGMLLRYDQLKIQQKHRVAFEDFTEGEITFPPTYKFDRGTSVYDTSEKQRVPSWTDRILWLSLERSKVSAENYQSHPECSFSDHKPVSAILNLPVSTVDERKRNELQCAVVNSLDKYATSSLPDVKLSPGPSVEFGEIAYNEPQTRTIEIVNTGQALAAWRFVQTPGSSSLLPPWLRISPLSGLLVPGEHATIALTIQVTASCASRLNFPLESDKGLDELFVVSIEKKDLFLAVSARSYQPTVFGSSLHHLSRIDKPIRSMTLTERQAVAGAVQLMKKPKSERSADEHREVAAAARVGVPRAIHQLVNFLSEHAVQDRDLFAKEGDAHLVDVVREALDTGSPIPVDRLRLSHPSPASQKPPVDDTQHLRDANHALERLESDIGSLALGGTETPPAVRSATPTKMPLDDEDGDERAVGLHSVAACLLALLDSLEEPVIPGSMYARALRCEKREEALGLVQDLPEVHANVLLYLFAFLRVLLAQTRDPKVRDGRLDQLAAVFSTVLLRAPQDFQPERIDVSTIPRRKKAFVAWLLLDERV